MSLKLTCVIAPEISTITGAARDRLAKAATAAMRKAGAELEAKGRAAISSGGLSSRFAKAFRVNTYPSSGATLTPAVFGYHKVPWAGVFESGATISGSPLLWLPIEANLPLQARGKRWTPRDFTNQIGPLRAGAHGGTPLLFGQVRVGQAGGVLALPSRRSNRIRFGKQKQVWRPVFVGVSSVTDPKKFDLAAVARDVANGVGASLLDNLEKSDG